MMADNTTPRSKLPKPTCHKYGLSFIKVTVAATRSSKGALGAGTTSGLTFLYLENNLYLAISYMRKQFAVFVVIENCI